MSLNTLFTTGLIVTLVISLMCCLKRQKKFLKFRTPDGRVPWGVIDMYLLIFSIFVIPTHLYPLVKGWVSGLNLLLTNPVHITPEGYIEDGNPMKSDFFFCFFLYMCQSIRLSVLDFSLARRLSVSPILLISPTATCGILFTSLLVCPAWKTIPPSDLFYFFSKGYFRGMYKLSCFDVLSGYLLSNFEYFLSSPIHCQIVDYNIPWLKLI